MEERYRYRSREQSRCLWLVPDCRQLGWTEGWTKILHDGIAYWTFRAEWEEDAARPSFISWVGGDGTIF